MSPTARPDDGEVQTTWEILSRWASNAGTTSAIADLNGNDYDYATLAAMVANLAARLRMAGVERTSRVGIILANGPVAAASFLAATTAGVAAPLNPLYRESEFEFYLSDLDVRALIVTADSGTEWARPAAKLGIEVIRIDDLQKFGEFDLSQLTDVPAASDNALLLHTSGTTARPKIVPLSHANLVASARHISTTLGLQPNDRSACIMPLFHIHGLMGVFMSSMFAGASVLCTSGLNAGEFIPWLSKHSCTWYSAVPSMHQAILAAAPKDLGDLQLRFLRSSSAALSTDTFSALEAKFGAPIIEAYGMTEAAHQMTSNRFDHDGGRKPGTVGLPSGPEVAILDDNDNVLEPGERGEVSIRGPNVTKGYLNNEEANASSFTSGWFRTGDQGFFDPDGFLVLTGRLKEQINRAGEKISPAEVDEILMSHPSVFQAVTFSMPDERLGEEVAAAVVLEKDAVISEQDLRSFVSAQCAYFKVPKRIVVLDTIPKGPTGKLRRLGLAEQLGLPGNGGVAPASPPQARGLWRRIVDFLTKDPGADDGDEIPGVTAANAAITRSIAEILAGLGDKLRAKDIVPDAHFFDTGYLDSFRAQSFRAQIKDTYGVAVTDVDLVQRLTSLNSLALWIQQELDKQSDDA